MQNVKVKKSELFSKLQENRDNHRKIFLEAQEGYRKRVIEKLDEMLENAKAGRRIEQYTGLQAPVDQTREYDTVISMLEMSTEDEITLSYREFQNYVRDDWSWKASFLVSNAAYSQTANIEATSAGYDLNDA